MIDASWTIRGLRHLLDTDNAAPADLAAQALARSNANSARNTYLWQDATWTITEAERAAAILHSQQTDLNPLCGLPISIKDCFDLVGAPTSCGVRFYRDLHGIATEDSWLVEQIRGAGAVIIGKTHLHPLAYGITGENPEFGDCTQPGKPEALTGGSSSGAAASVLEGSAVAAIGTDTGGSIRVPAALCGLAGYRATLGRGNWRGGAHLAPSFDTLGWLFRDLEDAPLLGAPFAPAHLPAPRRFTHFAIVEPSFLFDCEPEIVAGMRALVQELQALGLRGSTFSAAEWSDTFSIFAPIQAWEAARIHAGNYQHFQPAIRERLEWGARITDQEIASLRERHAAFRARLDKLVEEHELLLLPASPVARLAAAADHSETRTRLLRYTMPFSLGGFPAVTIPCAVGGVQMAAARERDESLLQLAADIGAQRRTVDTHDRRNIAPVEHS